MIAGRSEDNGPIKRSLSMIINSPLALSHLPITCIAKNLSSEFIVTLEPTRVMVGLEAMDLKKSMPKPTPIGGNYHLI